MTTVYINNLDHGILNNWIRIVRGNHFTERCGSWLS